MLLYLNFCPERLDRVDSTLLHYLDICLFCFILIYYPEHCILEIEQGYRPILANYFSDHKPQTIWKQTLEESFKLFCVNSSNVTNKRKENCKLTKIENDVCENARFCSNHLMPMYICKFSILTPCLRFKVYSHCPCFLVCLFWHFGES